MKSARSWPRRILGELPLVIIILVAVAAVAGIWLRGRMMACLPRLSGTMTLGGLASPVTVARDALGTATVDGTSRIDVARATGWVHAQDRFFQMDILRRRGAGELAEVFGSAALPLDREARLHGFRKVAQEVLARETPAHVALIRAYAEGVNAGLAELGAKPWEYVILRTQPRAWLPEDSILVGFAMTLDLEESQGSYVRDLATIRDELGPLSLAFYAPLMTPGDAALDATVGEAAPVPPASELDLPNQETTALPSAPWGDRQVPGSNAMAVAGRLASGGGALVANDMHLHLGVPNIWYRMSLRWPGHSETGVTLPGVPLLVAGSTGKVAWGFTVSKSATGDVLIVDPSISPDLYHGPHNGDLVPYLHRTETIAVKGAKAEVMDVRGTIWGPVVGEGPHAHPLAFHWTADDPAATNVNLIDLEDAATVQDAVAVAHRAGMPLQNFVVADASGQIAWTIAGFIPKRLGYDGRLPVTWLFGDRGWDGFLASADVPTIVAPASGLLWSTNNRVVGGKALERIGDSGYDLPARAAQVRDDLTALAQAGKPIEPKDLLAVQLDDRALMLGSWHDLLLKVLTPDVVSKGTGRASLLEAARNWEGRADTASTSYRVVRSFRLAVAHRVFDPIFATCVERNADFRWNRLNFEVPLQALLKARPAHLLDPAFRSWDELLAAAADDVIRDYSKQGLDPRTATWGERNTARIGHPFAQMLPRWASGLLSMPADELAGDANMPRLQDPSYGASERFVVSPGHEESGIFHMPGGQNSNPLSPYFRAGHEAWVRGDPSPFLPGPAVHILTLQP